MWKGTRVSTVEITWSGDVPDGALVARGRFTDDVFADPREAERARLAGFEGKPGQVHVALTHGGVELLVGLGPRERVDRGVLRRAAAALVRATGRAPIVAATLVADVAGAVPAADAAAAVASAAGSARYRYEAFRSKPSDAGPHRLHLVVPDGCDDAIGEALAVLRGVMLTRDLVNEPGGSLVPVALARRCEELTAVGVRVVVHDHAAVVALGMGGVLGVNRGSEQPCAFVELHWEPDGADTSQRLALVGKGITFDSGGIHIKKKNEALNAMKTDMGGAAAIIGAMQALAELQVPVAVSAYLPLTDNMTGGDATRPGDVLRMFDGTTVEVVDTDAEGRLVLGDAVAFAATTSPAAIVDVATLTGTSIHVTGLAVALYVSTVDWLAAQIDAASASSSDKVWRMPRVPEYRGLLNSRVADMCNRSEAPASSAFAGLFVESFAKGLPFAHIDMASVVSSDRDLDDRPAGATGWGVELLVNLVRSFEPAG